MPTPNLNGAISQLATEIKNADSAKWYRRLKIVQLSMAGKSVDQLAVEFDVCQPTIRSHIKAYNNGGIDALGPKVARVVPQRLVTPLVMNGARFSVKPQTSTIDSKPTTGSGA